MKLLHLTNRYPPYATGVPERQCRLVVNELANRGHLNRVLTSDVVLPNIPDREGQVHRQLRLATATGAQSFFKLVVMQWSNSRALAAILDDLAPDAVIVWGMAGLSHTLLWELERRRMRVVFAVLDHWPRHRLREDAWYQWWTSPLPFDQRLIRRVLRELRLANRVLDRFPARRPTELPLAPGFFASRQLRDAVRSAGYQVDGSEIVPHCLGRDDIGSATQRRGELRRLLWIGPFDADHDPLTAMQAIQEIRHEGEMRFSLDLFGHGDVAVEGRMRDFIRRAQLAGAVTIRNVGMDELANLFPTYDIFLCTARNPEPFPLVLLRVMAARIPVITTPEGSVGEIVRNGENALTFRTGDPVDCAQRITQLANDPELADKLVLRAHRGVLDTHSTSAVAASIERILSQVARPRGG